MDNDFVDEDTVKVEVIPFDDHTIDCNGEEHLLCTVQQVNSHHLDACYSSATDSFIYLDNIAKRRSCVRIFDCNTFEEVRIIDMQRACGNIGVSQDGQLLALSVIGEDTVLIYDIPSGEYLVDLRGSTMKGYWGCLLFTANNMLLDFRVNEMDRSQATKSTLRYWNTGFSSMQELEDLDYEEEESKCWELQYKCLLYICYLRHRNEFIVVQGEVGEVQWLCGLTGAERHYMRIAATTKVVLSSDERSFATAHEGAVNVYCSSSGDILHHVPSPSSEAMYPLVPLSFAMSDRWIISRINYSRMLVINSVADPHIRIITSHVGGTISDACSVSKEVLSCFPYGRLEFYDLKNIMQKMKTKYYRLRHEFLLLKRLYKEDRVVLLQKNDFSVLLKRIIRLTEVPFMNIIEYISN